MIEFIITAGILAGLLLLYVGLFGRVMDLKDVQDEHAYDLDVHDRDIDKLKTDKQDRPLRRKD